MKINVIKLTADSNFVFLHHRMRRVQKNFYMDRNKDNKYFEYLTLKKKCKLRMKEIEDKE